MNYHLKKVTLKVLDLEKMTVFYTQIIGLRVVEQTENSVLLGTDSLGFVELVEVADKVKDRDYTGLYHLAILVPDDLYLGQLFYHFRDVRYPLIGASDHGYSQAIYLEDHEGNGIEIYADRPRNEWDVHEDGTVDAITIAIDVMPLLKKAENKPW